MKKTLILLAAAALAALAPAAAPAQSGLTEAQIVEAAGRWHHGVGSLSPEYRARIMGDPRAPRIFRDLLEGRRTADFDTATALWWLAQADDPSLTPVFLRYADGGHGEGAAGAALYGLARRSTHPDANAHLRRVLSGSAGQLLAETAAGILVQVGDPPARSLLAGDGERGWSTRMREHVRRFRGSPQRSGQGYWPCAVSEAFRPDAAGVWRCTPDPVHSLIP